MEARQRSEAGVSGRNPFTSRRISTNVNPQAFANRSTATMLAASGWYRRRPLARIGLGRTLIRSQ